MITLDTLNNTLIICDKLNMVDEKIKTRKIINMILDKALENVSKEPEVEKAESTEN